MKYLKKYKKFRESVVIDLSKYPLDVNESFNIYYDALLKSINAEKVDITEEFKLRNGKVESHIDSLFKDNNFILQLSNIGYKMGNLEDTKDYETFMNKPCKFIFIYDINSSELENPLYILFQPEGKNVELYKVKDKVNNFYNKIASKTITVELDGKKWIYYTSNGNDWELQNIENETEEFKKSLRKEELEELLNDQKATVTIT